MIRFQGSDPKDAAQFIRGVGEMWLDTRTTPAVLQFCYATNPVQFRPMVLQSRTASPLDVASFQNAQAPPTAVFSVTTAPNSLTLLPTYVNSFLLPALNDLPTYINSLLLQAIGDFVAETRAKEQAMYLTLRQLLTVVKDGGLG